MLFSVVVRCVVLLVQCNVNNFSVLCVEGFVFCCRVCILVFILDIFSRLDWWYSKFFSVVGVIFCCSRYSSMFVLSVLQCVFIGMFFSVENLVLVLILCLFWMLYRLVLLFRCVIIMLLCVLGNWWWCNLLVMQWQEMLWKLQCSMFLLCSLCGSVKWCVSVFCVVWNVVLKEVVCGRFGCRCVMVWIRCRFCGWCRGVSGVRDFSFCLMCLFSSIEWVRCKLLCIM